MAFVVNRAHHADIGADSPGSMPISRHLDEEGIVIAPTKIVIGGKLNDEFMAKVLRCVGNEDLSRGDFFAQISANKTGVMRLADLISRGGGAFFLQGLEALNEYGHRMANRALGKLPDGVYRFRDVMDDDGVGHRDLEICAELHIVQGKVHVDFNGTANQVAGNINAPLSVAAAAVFYVFRCLMPSETPACAGTFRDITLSAPEGCLVNARRPAAVAAGNVETSTRVVDVILGALAQAVPDLIPAASHGSMNNVAMGGVYKGQAWNYYETIGGGMGAGKSGGGINGVQTHMTNTLNTPIESLEMHYPLRIRKYAIRHGSGGAGQVSGGNGLIREFEFLSDATLTLLTERRHHAPWGLSNGDAGKKGVNQLDGDELEAKCSLLVTNSQRLSILTPGGGGYGNKGVE